MACSVNDIVSHFHLAWPRSIDDCCCFSLRCVLVVLKVELKYPTYTTLLGYVLQLEDLVYADLDRIPVGVLLGVVGRGKPRYLTGGGH